MARRSSLSGSRRVTIDQSGAPAPQTNDDTVTIGRQDDKPAAPKPAPSKA